MSPAPAFPYMQPISGPFAAPARVALSPRPIARPPTRPGSGFTILEVMFASVVLALAITTSITTLQRAFIALDCARKVTLAGQIMQGELEKLRLQDWSTINAYPASADISAAVASAFGASAAITSSFTLTRTISDAHADMKQITLTAGWKSYDGRSYSRSYTSYYGKNGLYDYFYNSY